MAAQLNNDSPSQHHFTTTASGSHLGGEMRMGVRSPSRLADYGYRNLSRCNSPNMLLVIVWRLLSGCQIRVCACRKSADVEFLQILGTPPAPKPVDRRWTSPRQWVPRRRNIYDRTHKCTGGRGLISRSPAPRVVVHVVGTESCPRKLCLFNLVDSSAVSCRPTNVFHSGRSRAVRVELSGLMP